MGDQPAPSPPPQPRTPTVPGTLPARRGRAPEVEASRPRSKLLERELFGWVVFAVIIIVAMAAAWGTYIVLRQ